MVQKIGVTVNELLELECLKGTKILAGHRGLHRIVKNVTVMEVPDISNWVYPGDFLLTTAYSISHNRQALLELIPQLNNKNLSGLAIKPKRFLDSIPCEMIEQADELDFPLFELPMETSFSKCINEILGFILERHAFYLAKGEEAHRLFMDIVINGEGFERLTELLATLVDNTVVIMDQTGNILAKKTVNWDEKELIDNLQKAAKSSGQVLDPLDSGVKYIMTRLRDHPPLNEFTTPINAHGLTCGYLSVWDNNRPLTQYDFIMIDRAMSVSALLFLYKKSLSEVERRYRSEFLDDLLLSKKEDGLIERAEYLGWDLTLNYVAFVIDIDDFQGFTKKAGLDEITIQSAKERLFNNVFFTVRPDEQSIIGNKSDSIILLLAQPPGIEEEKVNRYMKRRGNEIYRSIKGKTGDITVSIGVGRFYPGITGLRKSYAEAIKALKIGRELFGNDQIFFFEDLGLYRLLYEIDKSPELKKFYQETIAPLDAHDAEHHSDLVKTLETYFDCQGNLKNVAQKLFVHYNTVFYRIERIQQITGMDLKSAEDCLNLQIGLKIRRIMKAGN